MQLLFGILRDIKIIDIIDIMLVTYGVYLALLFIEGTRAFNLLKGLGTILVFFIITRYFDLNTLSWILSNALPTGFLALIVIFQPEIRRALEDIGRGNFLAYQFTSSASISDMVEEIAKTIEACSKKRVGALIVLEQEIGLKEYIEKGVSIQGDISSELLNTIFMPYAPLHDGAVIIKDSKVAAAACFLPSVNENVGLSELGARHRAALGISEVSDALVFVVSEETGTISKAKNGKLMRNLPIDRVKKLLAAGFGRANRAKRIFLAK